MNDYGLSVVFCCVDERLENNIRWGFGFVLVRVKSSCDAHRRSEQSAWAPGRLYATRIFPTFGVGATSILLHKLLFVGRVNRQRKYTGWPFFFHTPRKVHLEVETTPQNLQSLMSLKLYHYWVLIPPSYPSGGGVCIATERQVRLQ